MFVFNHSFGTVRTCCAYGLNGLTLNDWLNIMMRDKKLTIQALHQKSMLNKADVTIIIHRLITYLTMVHYA